MSNKVCTRCNKKLPATLKYFYKDARLSDGLYTRCKACHSVYCRREGRTKRAYKNMIQRCHNPKASNYPWYGALGVQVCKRWRALYENFRSDMGECPEGKSITRFGAVGNYEPSNCAWMTRAEQGAEVRKKYTFCRTCGQEKTRVNKTGYKECLPCRNARQREYRKRDREHQRRIGS
jgi:hypothetical protein